MNSSPTFKWLVTVLVPLSLGWKLIGGETTSSETKIDIIIDFLSHQGFEVTRKNWGDYAFIDATTPATGACRMIVVEVSPDGWTRDVVRQIFLVQRNASSLSFAEALIANNPLG